jgi:hypothetical protein
MILKRGWLLVSVFVFVGCAGKLRDPDRFGFLNDDDDGGTSMGESGAPATAGKPAMSMDAGTMTPAATPPPCVAMVFKNKCGDVGCHGAGTTPQVDLVTTGVEKRLVNKKSSSALLCKDRTLVTTDGSDSLLIEKITGPDCGSMMPVGKTLTSDERTCLTGWVSSLAN